MIHHTRLWKSRYSFHGNTRRECLPLAPTQKPAWKSHCSCQQRIIRHIYGSPGIFIPHIPDQSVQKHFLLFKDKHSDGKKNKYDKLSKTHIQGMMHSRSRGLKNHQYLVTCRYFGCKAGSMVCCVFWDGVVVIGRETWNCIGGSFLDGSKIAFLHHFCTHALFCTHRCI